GEPDIADAARAGDAVASALLDFLEHDTTARRHRAPERHRRTRRGIDLALVAHLHDFDVPVGTQPARHLLDYAQQHIDADAHIGRPDDRNLGCRLAHSLALLGREAGRADHHRLADLGSERGVFYGGGGRGEFKHDIAVADQLLYRLTDRDAHAADS